MTKLLNPAVVIILVVLLHALVGIPNYFFYSAEIDIALPSVITVLFIISLVLPVLFTGKRYLVFTIDHQKAYKLSLYMLLLAMIINAFYVFVLGFTASGGFLERFSRIPILINLSQLGIPASLMLYYLSMSGSIGYAKVKIFFLILLFMLMQMSLGYRSPIFVLLLSLFAMNLYFRIDVKKKSLKIRDIGIALIVVAAGALLISVVAIMRVESDYSYVDYYTQIYWTEVSSFWDQIVPFAATMRADYVSLESFLLNLKQEELFPGAIFFSDLITWLPGTQLGSRNIVGDYIGARLLPNGVPMSITVSLHGIIYSDFGWLGLIIAGTLLAGILIFLRRSISFGSACLLPIFVFMLINIVKSIHSGYLDFSFYFQMGSLFFICWTSKSIKDPKVDSFATILK